MGKQKQNKATSSNEKKSNTVLISVIISVIIMLAVFAAVLFIMGYVFYSKEVGYNAAWIVYLCAAALSSGASSFFAAGKLPLRGIITGLAYALFSVVVHSAVMSGFNPDTTGSHTMIILCFVIAISVTCGIFGANLSKSKKRAKRL